MKASFFNGGEMLRLMMAADKVDQIANEHNPVIPQERAEGPKN